MPEAGNIGFPVNAVTVPDWNFYSSQIKLGCAENQIIISERIEFSEVMAVPDNPFVIRFEKYFRSA